MAKDKVCGIYKITNKDNGKVYVGQSVDVARRFHEHKYELENGKHVNSALQRSYNLHGVDAFEYEVIEECSAESLNEREIFWIGEMNAMVPNGYNLMPGGECENGRVWDNDTRNAASLDVICLSTMEMYESAREASEETGIERSSIARCCGGLTAYCVDTNDNYTVWAYTDNLENSEDKWGFIADKLERARTVIERSNDECGLSRKEVICLNTMERFKSVNMAGGAYGIGGGSVSECCSGKYAYTGKVDGIGLVWAYASEFDNADDQDAYVEMRMQAMYDALSRKNNIKCISKPVVCLNNGKKFPSIKVAADWAGVDRSNISYALSGKILSAGADETGSRLVWRSAETYDMMSEEEVAAAIAAADPKNKRYHRKAVVCLNNLTEYKSSKEAATAMDVSEYMVIDNCLGRSLCCFPRNDEAVWIVFRYKEDFDKMSQDEIEQTLLAARCSKSKRPVRCITTGETFASITSAAKRYNINNSNIVAVCKGRLKGVGVHPETGEILSWEYLSDDETTGASEVA